MYICNSMCYVIVIHTFIKLFATINIGYVYRYLISLHPHRRYLPCDSDVGRGYNERHAAEHRKGWVLERFLRGLASLSRGRRF